MITITEGKKFKKAFHVYNCKKCGFKGFMAVNADVVNFKTGQKYEDDMYSKKTKHVDGYIDDHTVCPYCDNTIGHAIYTEERDKDYMKELVGKPVKLCNGVSTVLTIDDLFI